MAADFVELYQAAFRASHQGQYETATDLLLQALALKPDDPRAVAGLGMVLLARGLYQPGFAMYEARKVLDPTPVDTAGLPEWTGEPLQGRRLLVYPEQGLGDEIQMARYIPRLRELGEVALVCSAPLVRLFGQFAVPVTAKDDPLPGADLYVRDFSLPARLGTTLQTIPPAPYLTAPSDPRSGGVGFVWRGDPAHPNDARRSLPSPALLDPLKDLAELVDLQTPRGDFLDTAARIQALDLVISVDTAMVHLAGALGVACWVMLPAEGCDWRWMRERTDSPWYGSLTLFRQRRPGDWTEVVARMSDALARGSG